MSRTIDERVVSMQFDNKHFESNVKTTMSTLDKLKQSLNLTGASKGLESINTAASKCNLSPLSKAAETVSLKFSAMEVMATTALANITNSAVNAGKKLVSSLSVDQITAGWSKYEQKTASVQTIMNATGKSIDEVNAYLEKLMWFSDETSYGFTDMTSALATMTSTGGDIDKLIPLLMGVANATAFAGKGAAEFSRVLQYGINQAYSLGYMQVMDWKTIEGATVNSKQLMEELIKAGEELGKIEKGSITSSTFRSSLADKWLDTEVMEKAFGVFAEMTEKAYEMVNSGEVETASEAYEILSKKYDGVSMTAAKAAQEAKTFTEAIDATKDAVSSGWLKSFEIIFGDYEKAKKLWTELANFLWEVFASGAEIRNAILESALGKTFLDLSEKMKVLIGPASKTAEVLDTITDSASDLSDIVNKVIKGDFGNGQERIDKLSEAGYNYYRVQNKVNEALGSSYRHAEGLVESQDEVIKSTNNLTKVDAKNIATLAEMSEEQLRQKNYTDEQIAALKELKTMSEKLGIPIEKLVENMDELSGRWLLIESVKNIGRGLIDIFNAVKEAWEGIFPPKSMEEKAEMLFNIIAAVHKFTTSLTGVIFQNGELTDTGEKLVRTLKGVFAIIDIITTIAGGAFKIAFKVLTQILGYFDMDILDLTAKIGDIIVKFRDWVDSLFDVSDILDTIVPIIEKAADAVKQFVDKLKELWNGDGNVFSKIGESLKLGAQSINDAISGLWSGSAEDILSGLINGLKSGATRVWEAAVALAKSIWEGFCNFLGIKSPSTKMAEAGEYVVDGAVVGLQNGLSGLIEMVKNIASKIVEAFKKLDLAKAAAVLSNLFVFFPKAGILKMAGAAMIIFNNLGMDAILGLKNGLASGTGSVLSTVGDLISALVEKVKTLLGINSPSKVFFDIGAFVVLGLIAGIMALFPKAREALKNFAKSLFENFGSTTKKAGEGLSNILTTIKNVVVKIFTSLVENLDSIIAILGGIGLIAIVLRLAKVVEGLVSVVSCVPKAISGMFKSFGKSAELVGKAIAVIGFATAILILSKALTILSSLSWKQILSGIGWLALLAVVLGGMALAVGGIGKRIGVGVKEMLGTAAVMIAMAGALTLLVYALTLMDDIDPETIWKKVAVIGALAAGLVTLALLLGKAKSEMSKGIFTMLGIAIAITLLVGAISKLNVLTIDNPGKLISTLLTLVGGLGLVALMSRGISFGSALGMIGIVLGIRMFISTLEKLAEVDLVALKTSLGTIIVIMGLFAGLMVATRFAGDNAKSAGIAMLAIALALRIVVGAIKAISGIDEGALKQGTRTIAAILALFGTVVALSYFAGEHALKAGAMLIEMSIALLIIVGAMAIISHMDPDGLKQGLIAISILITLIGGVIFASSKAGEAKVALIALAIIIGMLVVAIGIFSMMDPKKLYAAVGAISGIMLVLSLLIASLKFIKTGKGDAFKTIATLVILTGVIAIIAWILKQLSGIEDIDAALKIAGALSGVLLAVATACLILSKAKGLKKTAVKNAMMLSVILGWIAIVLMACNYANLTTDLNNVLGLAALLEAVSVACVILSKSKGITKTAVKNAMLASVILGWISVVLIACDAANLTTDLNNVLALTILLEAVSAACLILSKAKGLTKTAVKNAMLAAIILGEIAVVLAFCDLLDVQTNLSNILALTVLLEAVAAACVILTKAKGITKATVKNAMLVAVILGEIALVLALCNALNVQASLGNVVALAFLLEAVAAACVILSTANGINTDTVGKAMLVAIILGEIALVLALCNVLNVQANLGTVLSLAILLEAIAVACLILSKCSPINPDVVLVMAVLGLVILELAMVLSVIQRMAIASSIGMVIQLSALLIAMSIVTLILSKIGSGASAAISGAASMMAVIAIIGAIAVAIGGLMTLFKPETLENWKVGLEAFMDFLVIFCTGLGEAIGGFIGGVFGGAIAAFGTGLSDFMTNIQTFIEGAKQIDSSVLSGIGYLAGAIVALTAASVLDGLASMFGLGSFDGLGAKLASFGACMKDFATAVADLSEDDIAKIKTAAEAGTAMADMAKSVPRTGGWWQEIAGEADLESFGLRMEAFGKSLVQYAKSIMELTEEDINRIKTSASVGNAMAELEAAVPKQGGWWQDIAGESNIETFGLRMEAFGKSLIKYAASISTLTADDANRISDSATAGNAMTALEDSVPKQDGWWQAIAGESDIETFGLRMVAFGNALVDYVTAVSELPDNASETIDKSKKAAEALVAVADVIPKDGGWWGDIAGEQNIGEFGTGMYNVARGLKKYSEVAAEIDDTDVENIENTEPAIKALKNIISVLPKDWSAWTGVDSIGNISTFGNGLVSLANGVVKYANVAVELDQKKIDAVTNSKTAIVALADAAKALPNEGGFAAWLSGDNNNFASFGSGMCSLIQYVVDYSAKATGITEDAYVSINNSAAAISAMAMAAKALPNDGGMVSWLSGDNNNLALFGTSMCALIQHVVDYAAIAVGLSEDGINAIGHSKLAIIGMTDAAKALPNDGGIVSWFSGDNNNFAAFGEGMCAVARAAVEYYGIVSSSGFSGDFDATASKSLIQGLVDAARSAQSLTAIDLSSVSTTVDELIKIANLAKSLAGTDFGNMGSFAKALGSLGQSGVDSFLRAFSGSYGKARQVGEAMMTNLIAGANVGMNSVIAMMNGLSLKMVAAISTKAIVFMTQGSLLMTRLASGILRAKQTVIDAVSSVLSGAFGDLTYVYMDWYHVGTYLVDGFASGISSRTWKAKAQASAMAQAALNAAKKVLDINSPSKKFREIGRSVPEGFALGIGDLGTSVKKAAENMAQKAMSNMRNAISKVLDVINLDVDTQPTIRPVLDLDDVASGVQTLNSMLGVNPSMSMLSNVNSVGSMMNRNQNGASRNESTNPIYNTYNSYNIDGVTYDDGSNVANAVETLIRATKVGGRR